MKKQYLVIGIILIVAFVSTQALAFDGDRKGFMLNLGAGVGQGALKLSGGGDSETVDETGFATDFKIGAGLSPQSVLYYTNRVVWWSSNGISVNTGMSAVGFSYFLKPEAPSFFFSGSLGLGVAVLDNDESESGMGFGIGAGYEFARNWIFELTYLNAKVWEESGYSISASNLALTISWFAY